MLELKQIESFYPENLRHFKRNILREYLQYKILEIIYSSDMAEKLVFMGGTAIHIIYSNPRFSEDLDFDNRGLDKNGSQELSALIKKRLELEGYNLEIKNTFKEAFSSDIKIADILYLNKLSNHKQEQLLIKLDTEPQNFDYTPDKIIINKFDVFSQLNVAPLDLLLAQKIYAIFKRRRPMGRDFYDTIFLLGKIKPDFGYLKQKLNITNLDDLKIKLAAHCKSLDFKTLASDVERFLFISDDAKKILLFCEYVNGL